MQRNFCCAEGSAISYKHWGKGASKSDEGVSKSDEGVSMSETAFHLTVSLQRGGMLVLSR